MPEPTEILQFTPDQVDYLKAVLRKNQKTISYLVHHLEENNQDAAFCNSEEDITEAINILSNGESCPLWIGLDFGDNSDFSVASTEERTRRIKNVFGHR